MKKLFFALMAIGMVASGLCASDFQGDLASRHPYALAIGAALIPTVWLKKEQIKEGAKSALVRTTILSYHAVDKIKSGFNAVANCAKSTGNAVVAQTKKKTSDLLAVCLAIKNFFWNSTKPADNAI